MKSIGITLYCTFGVNYYLLLFLYIKLDSVRNDVLEEIKFSLFIHLIAMFCSCE